MITLSMKTELQESPSFLKEGEITFTSDTLTVAILNKRDQVYVSTTLSMAELIEALQFFGIMPR